MKKILVSLEWGIVAHNVKATLTNQEIGAMLQAKYGADMHPSWCSDPLNTLDVATDL